MLAISSELYGQNENYLWIEISYLLAYFKKARSAYGKPPNMPLNMYLMHIFLPTEGEASTVFAILKNSMHTYIHTYTLLSIPERGFSASILIFASNSVSGVYSCTHWHVSVYWKKTHKKWLDWKESVLMVLFWMGSFTCFHDVINFPKKQCNWLLLTF